jgi:hypothetical protein
MGYRKRFISPVCPIHRQTLLVTSKQPPFRYFKCPEPGCSHTQKRVITDFVAVVEVVRGRVKAE